VGHIIETFSLTKRFSKAKSFRSLLRFRRQEDLTAVDRVTLQIREGELFGLLGPNGAGKTTLIKMLCTLILPSEGRALVDGEDVVAGAAAVKSMIGLVDCQERSFFWRLSGWQNLEFFATLYGLRSAEAEERIAALLDLVGLTEHAGLRVLGYSSGMRQKLAVARGLLAMPRLIFMDEPTRGLDPVTARELRAFIRDTLVAELGRTVVLVTHHIEEAEELCDRVAIMNHGQVVACGPTEEIKRRLAVHQEYRLRVAHLPATALDGLRAIPGVAGLRWTTSGPHGLNVELLLENEAGALPEVIRSIVSQGGDVQHCDALGFSLEQAFVQLVNDGGDGLQGAGLYQA
jgi:ABC-2 type transport system ATP-binding protein